MQQGRTLDQIIAELNPTFQPQIKSLEQRASTIPGQIQAEEAGLQGKQTEAFGDILSGARRRGLGFSGIPLSEQAQYTSTEFLPAMARLRQSGREQAMSLQDAILGIRERRDTLGQQIFQTEKDRSFQREQAEANRRAQAAQAAQAAATFGSLNFPGNQEQKAGPRAILEGSGNAQFLDAGGKPITAGQYARQSGLDIRDVLYDIGSNGNATAADIYNKLRPLSGSQLSQAIQSFSQRFPYVFAGYQANIPYRPGFNPQQQTQQAPARTSTGIQPNLTINTVGRR